MTKTFLKAEWRKLAMANYSVDKKLLYKYLPLRTELDVWNNTCYVSLVGFMCKNTKISDDKTSEYGVEHPKWEVYQTKNYLVDVDFGNLYGQDFKFLTTEKPKSVFLAEGSEIRVKSGRQI